MSSISSATRPVLAVCISFSFILVGNAITQSFMGVPALLVDFPPPSSPDHSRRAKLLGRQWPTFWKVGNRFFRPISTLGALGYAFLAVRATMDKKASTGTLPEKEADRFGLYVLAAAAHVFNVLFSAVRMQPLNERLEALAGDGKEGVGRRADEEAVGLARQWIKGNYVRVACPLVAGVAALYGLCV